MLTKIGRFNSDLDIQIEKVQVQIDDLRERIENQEEQYNRITDVLVT